MRSGHNRQRVKETFSFAEDYHKLYNDLSPLSHLFNTRLARVYELLGPVGGLDVLDVGCGPGVVAEHIIENGGRYFGIDLSKEMLKECQRTLGNSQTCYLSQAIMESLSFPDAAFDRVLCLGALEYVEDSDLAIAELSRVMREDTIVILSMQNIFGLYRLWDRRVYSGSLFNTLRKLRRRPIPSEPLENLTSLKDLRGTLSRHNLIVKDVLFYNFNLWLKPLDRLFPKLSIMTSRRLEFLSQSMVGSFLGADFLVKAQKVVTERSRD